MIAETDYVPMRVPFACDLVIEAAVRDIDIDDMFTVSPVFLPKLGKSQHSRLVTFL